MGLGRRRGNSAEVARHPKAMIAPPARVQKTCWMRRKAWRTSSGDRQSPRPPVGIDTGQEAVVYLHRDSPIVRATGRSSLP